MPEPRSVEVSISTTEGRTFCTVETKLLCKPDEGVDAGDVAATVVDDGVGLHAVATTATARIAPPARSRRRPTGVGAA
jgi:hypothetical protein